MAPEVLSKGTAYDSSADWFSFGCMLYKLLKGHSPFRQHKTKDKHEIDRMTLTMVSETSRMFTAASEYTYTQKRKGQETLKKKERYQAKYHHNKKASRSFVPLKFLSSSYTLKSYDSRVYGVLYLFFSFFFFMGGAERGIAGQLLYRIESPSRGFAASRRR